MFAYLRITVAMFFALLCLASCALWVRSYYVGDTACGPIGKLDDLRFISARGKLVIRVKYGVGRPGWPWHYYEVEPYSFAGLWITDSKPPMPIRFGWKRGQNSVAVIIPQWFIVAFFGGSSVLLSRPISFWATSFRRFSVRDLLILAALICTLMGLMVMAVR